jgi:hypothetical protein
MIAALHRPARQLELFPITPVTLRPDLDEQFAEFHRLNPHVYNNLRTLAFRMVRAGRRHVGIKLLFERLRWEYSVRTSHREEEYAMNNNYTSRYARLLMDQEIELRGVFEVRRLHESDPSE